MTVTISVPRPVVLYFPDHSLLSPSQDQHGHTVPSNSAIAFLVASAASSAVGAVFFCCLPDDWRQKCDVPRYRDWATSKMSTHKSSMMFCRRYLQVTINASRKVGSRGRLSSLFHGSSSSSHAAFKLAKLLLVQSDIRSNRNGFSC